MKFNLYLIVIFICLNIICNFDHSVKIITGPLSKLNNNIDNNISNSKSNQIIFIKILL